MDRDTTKVVDRLNRPDLDSMVEQKEKMVFEVRNIIVIT